MQTITSEAVLLDYLRGIDNVGSVQGASWYKTSGNFTPYQWQMNLLRISGSTSLSTPDALASMAAIESMDPDKLGDGFPSVEGTGVPDPTVPESPMPVPDEAQRFFDDLVSWLTGVFDPLRSLFFPITWAEGLV